MKWIITTISFSFLCFVIWKITLKERKKRVIIDIRALNKIIILNVYFVSSQANILAAIKNAKFIFTIDAASFFYQWWINSTHRHRLIVISHRDQKSFKVPIMSYRNSSIYVQRIINKIFRSYRYFCRVYVDNIVIFFMSLKEHLAHLRLVFSTLKKMNIHLSSRKSFLDYPSIQLLSQKIDVLKLITTEKKFVVIANLFFSKTFAQLKKYFDLIEYLR